MAKRYHQLLLLLAISLSLAPLCAAKAAGSQIIQIHTHLDKISGSPSWIIIIHDADSQAVYPYLFDLDHLDDYFLIFINARNYRIVSMLQMDPYHQKFQNFCHFPQKIISNTSLDLQLTGSLTSHLRSARCKLIEYKVNPYNGSLNKDE